MVTGLTLSWSGVGVAIPTASGPKKILDGVSGEAHAGEMLAIMGPSGAGKTSLLNCLAKRNNEFEGALSINGRDIRSDDSLNRSTAYMNQSELFLPELTVREHLLFQAEIRTDYDAAAREQRVDEVLAELGLDKVASSLIGDAAGEAGDHISRNERKRLNFASEILTDPSLLFVDEPTTGLDSHMAESVVKNLRALAQGKQKRTIVATIHQPSSDVYRLFDKLCFLVDGRVAYFGRADAAVAFFSKIGYPPPAHCNPADHIMRLFVNPNDPAGSAKRRLEICDNFAASALADKAEQGEVATAAEAAEKDAWASEASEAAPLPGGAGAGAAAGKGGAAQHSNVRMLMILVQREWTMRKRSKQGIWSRLVLVLFLGTWFGTTYWQMEVNQLTLSNLTGALFFNVVIQLFTAVNLPPQTVTAQMPVFIREARAGSYSLGGMYIAKQIVDLPIDFMFCALWMGITFPMIGFGWTAWSPELFAAYGRTLFAVWFTVFATQGSGYIAAFGAPISAPDVAFLLAIAMVLPQILFGGLFINIDQIPSWLHWIRDVCPLRYGFEAVMNAQWQEFGELKCTGDFCPYSEFSAFKAANGSMYTSQPAGVLNGTAIICRSEKFLQKVCVAQGKLPAAVCPQLPLCAVTKKGTGLDVLNTFSFKESNTYLFSCLAVLCVLLRLAAYKCLRKHAKPSIFEGAMPDSGTETLPTADTENIVDTTKDANPAARRDRDPISLLWHNVCFEPRPGLKVMEKMCGKAEPGKLLTILGPSGCGKTSLLNALASRNRESTGTVLYNGEAWTDELAGQCAYMNQEDLFLEQITVREHLIVTSQLKMDASTTEAQRLARIDAVIAELGLDRCQGTLIGKIGSGISGGERKRLSLASELLSDPALLFVDEPSSGLDSAMAESVIELLKNLATGSETSGPRTIVATIHQPSTDVFEMFDDLMIISNGRVAYAGEAGEASIDYFDKLGWPCPADQNPPDHFMRLVSNHLGADIAARKESAERVSKILDAYTLPDPPSGAALDGAAAKRKPNTYDRSTLEQIRVLYSRENLIRVRSRFLFQAMIGRTIILSGLVGVVWMQLENSQVSVQSYMGVLQFISLNTFFATGGGLVNTLPLLMPAVIREHHNGMYRISAWYAARVLSDTPWDIIFPTFYATATYFLVGFSSTPLGDRALLDVLAQLGYMCALITFCAQIGAAWAYTAASLCKTKDSAFALFSGVGFPWIYYSGLFIKSSDVPWYYGWLSNTSPFKPLYNNLVINTFRDYGEINCPSTGACAFPSGDRVLEYFIIDKDDFASNWVGIVVFFLICRVLAWLGYMRAAKRKAIIVEDEIVGA